VAAVVEPTTTQQAQAVQAAAELVALTEYLKTVLQVQLILAVAAAVAAAALVQVLEEQAELVDRA
jgi:hypothetical protein